MQRHQLDRFRARWWLLAQLTLPVQLISGIEKVLMAALADQGVDLRFREPLFVQIPRFKLNFELEQETSCFPASASSWLLIEDCLCRHSPPTP